MTEHQQMMLAIAAIAGSTLYQAAVFLAALLLPNPLAMGLVLISMALTYIVPMMQLAGIGTRLHPTIPSALWLVSVACAGIAGFSVLASFGGTA